jgi:hypothetical protein
MEHLFVVISHSSRSLSKIYEAFNDTDGGAGLDSPLFRRLSIYWDAICQAASDIHKKNIALDAERYSPCITPSVFQIERCWRSTMPQFLCASLSNLAKLWRERYDARSKMILRNFPDEDLLAAEHEIIRINRLISRHRRRCSLCKARESLVAFSPQRMKSLSIETPRFPMNMAS